MMEPAIPDFETLKAGIKAAWMAGDFGKIASYTGPTADEFVRRLDIPRGARVLDIGCGTGNAALSAARTGAFVSGVDIATNLIEEAREHAAAEHLGAQFQEGDAEELPFPDHSFDIVLTLFGAMFAPRPDRVIEEMLRVCKPGGKIAMANWSSRGFVGEQFELMARHSPAPPGIPAPTLWGDESVVQQRFSRGVSALVLTRRVTRFTYPFNPRGVVQLLLEYFGPMQVSFSRLDETGKASLLAQLEALWSRHNLAIDDTTIVEGDYLEVIAEKRGIGATND